MVTQFRMLLILALLLALLGCKGKSHVGKATRDDNTIPLEYRALYEELSEKLDRLQARVNSVPRPGNAGTRFGVELLVANSNRGEILLTERVFRATVLTLDRLQSLGVQSIALSIQFPVLVPSQPRADEYLNFYTRVIREIRQRGRQSLSRWEPCLRSPNSANCGLITAN